jgi:hypothetical protein
VRPEQSGSFVFTSRLVGKGFIIINLVPTPQVKQVSSCLLSLSKIVAVYSGCTVLGASVKTCQSFLQSLVHLKGITKDKIICQLFNHALRVFFSG